MRFPHLHLWAEATVSVLLSFPWSSFLTNTFTMILAPLLSVLYSSQRGSLQLSRRCSLSLETLRILSILTLDPQLGALALRSSLHPTEQLAGQAHGRCLLPHVSLKQLPLMPPVPCTSGMASVGSLPLLVAPGLSLAGCLHYWLTAGTSRSVP